MRKFKLRTGVSNPYEINVENFEIAISPKFFGEVEVKNIKESNSFKGLMPDGVGLFFLKNPNPIPFFL